MSPRARRTLDRWGELILTSGLAAVIATLGIYAIDRGKSMRDLQTRRCEIAQAFLSDETPTPYTGDRNRRRITEAAAMAFDRCLKER